MSTPNNYTIGWICAGTVVYSAAQKFLDEKHERLDFGNNNKCVLGRIGGHNVVLAYQYGYHSRAVVENLVRNFTSLRVCFFVSIGGGAPSQRHDIRLGDVFVGFTHYNTESVFQHDHELNIRGVLHPPPMLIQNAIERLRTEYETKNRQLQSTIVKGLSSKGTSNPKFPDPSTDKLYVSSFTHAGGDEESCETVCGDERSRLIPRSPRSENGIVSAIHYGLISSRSRPIKNAATRDRLAAEKHLLCFETRASRLMNHLPCLVICGIHSYCDTHRTEAWEDYAAAAAAAYARDLLGILEPSKIEAGTKFSEIFFSAQENGKYIIRWLSQSYPSANLNRTLYCRHRGTGSWFFQHPRYLVWRSEARSFIWLIGIPGCGKTILTSSVIVDLMRTRSNNIVYFYFDSRGPQQQTPNDLLRSLIVQLYKRRMDTRIHLESLYSMHQNNQEPPSLDSLCRTFQNMVRQVGEVWIIIDAIDECSTNKEARGLLPWIEELRRMQANIHIFITSRQEPDTKTIHSHINPGFIFPIHNDLIKGDIDAYIHSRVSTLRTWDSHDQRKIESLLVKKADGMFRWVSCQLDALEMTSGQRTIKQIIRSLPTVLEDMYTRVLEKVPNRLRLHTLRLLQFLALSERPLHINEVIDALTVDPKNIPQLKPITRFADPEDIFKCCPGFIVVTNERSNRSNIEISLAHHSIKKYLMASEGKIPRELRRTIDKGHIAEVCLAYLLQLEPDNSAEQIRKIYPLAQYAAQYWTVQASKSEHRLQKLILRLFRSQRAFGICYQLYSPDKPRRNVDEYEEPPPALYYASFAGLLRSVQSLLEAGADVNAHGGLYGNALQAASFRGYIDIVFLLLDHGADINIQGGKYGSALQAAIHDGCVDVIIALLDGGANINAQGGVYGSALEAALHNNRRDIARLLLDRGADVSVVKGNHIPPNHNEISSDTAGGDISSKPSYYKDLWITLKSFERLEHIQSETSPTLSHRTPVKIVRTEDNEFTSSRSNEMDENTSLTQPDSRSITNTSNTTFRPLNQDPKWFAHLPQSIDEALQTSNIEVLHDLIAKRFDQVAVGEYAWLRELKEFGYSATEMTDLISEQYNDSPWIFSEPIEHGQAQIQPNFHLTDCAHHILENSSSLGSSSWSLPMESHSTTDEHVAQLLHELCGIAGVRPRSRDRQSWAGFVEFQVEDNAAFVSYGPNENGGPYHQPLLTRIHESLSGFCTAVSKVQDMGLCCNCFTIAVRPEAGVRSPDLMQLHQIPLRLASNMLSIFQEYISGRGIIDRLVSEAADYASKIVGCVVPVTVLNTERSMEASLHLCALATQLLCVGFVSYAQAHAGSIRPFFLDMDLKVIHLLGTRKAPNNGISVELVNLACIGEMIHDQAITFGRLRLAGDQVRNTEQKFFVSTSIGDLLDTWGPGKLVVLKNNPNHISAIRLGSGVIWCSDTEKSIFHWSEVPPSEPPEPVYISPDTQLVIGSLVTWNKRCNTQIEQCWTRSIHHLEQLGTHKPYWEDAEWQIGLQAGNYAIVQVNHTWARIRGQTLKQCRLQQDDRTLVFFLEEPWGLQISYCTGVARRAPLREVVADLLDIFLSVYNTTKMDREIWEELKNLGIVEALRRPNFNDFLCKLETHFNPDTKVADAIIRMIRTILRALEPTGIHQGKLVVACFWGQEIFRCFKIPCQNDHAWANVLADSEDCATFAYMSTRCLETQKIVCPKTNDAWKNRILLMQTSIVLCSAPEPTQSLEDKQIYFFDKFEKEIFVLARKPKQAIAAELTMTSFLNTPRTFILRLKAKDGRNKHRGRIREMQKVEESAEPVFVL